MSSNPALKVSIIMGNNNYTKKLLLLELYIYISNHSKNTYTINGHSFPDLFLSSSIPPPGKWSDRTKEALMFLSHTPSLLDIIGPWKCRNSKSQ